MMKIALARDGGKSRFLLDFVRTSLVACYGLCQVGVGEYGEMKKHLLTRRRFSYEAQKEFGIALFSLANFMGGSLIIGQAFRQDGFFFIYFFSGVLVVIFMYRAAIHTLNTLRREK